MSHITKYGLSNILVENLGVDILYWNRRRIFHRHKMFWHRYKSVNIYYISEWLLFLRDRRQFFLFFHLSYFTSWFWDNQSSLFSSKIHWDKIPNPGTFTSLSLHLVLHSKTKIQSGGKPGSSLKGKSHKRWRPFTHKSIQFQTHIDCANLGCVSNLQIIIQTSLLPKRWKSSSDSKPEKKMKCLTRRM